MVYILTGTVYQARVFEAPDKPRAGCVVTAATYLHRDRAQIFLDRFLKPGQTSEIRELDAKSTWPIITDYIALDLLRGLLAFYPNPDQQPPTDPVDLAIRRRALECEPTQVVRDMIPESFPDLSDVQGVDLDEGGEQVLQAARNAYLRTGRWYSALGAAARSARNRGVDVSYLNSAIALLGGIPVVDH